MFRPSSRSLIPIALCLGGTLPAQDVGAAPVRGELLRAVPGKVDPFQGRFHQVRRSRVVRIDTKLLDSVRAGDVLRVSLFADATFDAVFEKKTVHGPRSYDWTGTLRGHGGSQFQLSSRKGAVVANFIPLDGRATSLMIQVAPGVQVVRERDESLCKCGVTHRHGIELPVAPVPQKKQAGGTGPLGTGPLGSGPLGSGCAESGDKVRVLIVYTAAARAQAGSAAKIQASAQNMMKVANTCLANARMNNLRYVLAAYHETKDSFKCNTSNNWSATLSGIAARKDGYMDDVHAARDKAGADLVALLVANNRSCQQNTAGLAGLLQSLNGSAESILAFSVNLWDGNYVLAHEIGHNMGLGHDPWTGGNSGPFAYSRGWKWNGTKPGTSVMGYGSFSQPSFPIYSTPLVKVGSAAAGDAQRGDAVRTLQQTRVTVANYRGGCRFPFGKGCSGGMLVFGKVETGQQYQLGGWAPQGFGLAYLGFSRRSYGAIPLPLDLGAVIGATGCSLDISLDVPLWAGRVPTTSRQFAVVPISVPKDSTLVGVPFYHQWLFAAPNRPVRELGTSLAYKLELEK